MKLEKILCNNNVLDPINNNLNYLLEFHDAPITINEIKENFKLQYKRYLIQKFDVFAHHPDKLEKRKEYLDKTNKLLKKFCGGKKV